MSEMSLNRKVTIAFAILVFVIAGTGVLSNQTASYQRSASSEISEIWLPSVTKSSEINLNVTRFRLAELDFLVADDTDSRAAIKSQMEEFQQNLFIYRKVFEPLIRGEQQQKLYDDFSEAWDKYSESHELLLTAVESDRKEEATRLINATNAQFEILSGRLSNLANASFESGTQASEAAGKAYQIGKWVTMGLSAFSVLLILAVGLLIRRDVRLRLGPISEKTASSALEIQDSVTVLADSSERLSKAAVDSAASLEETVASMEELTAVGKVNSENAQSAAMLSRKSQESVNLGQGKIRMMIENIKEVHESSHKIGEILTLIEDISFQTNLLALNAAVEAARAGEQGKGFAVVADAVRSLAQKSSESAKEIGSLISTSNEKTELGVRYAGESEEALSEIVDSVGKVGSLIQEISTAAHEQESGLSQISTALTQIDQAIQGNAANTMAISESAKSLQRQAVTLTDAAGALSRFSGIKERPPSEDADGSESENKFQESLEVTAQKVLRKAN